MTEQAKVMAADRAASAAILTLGEVEAAQFVTFEDCIAVEISRHMQTDRDLAAKLAESLADAIKALEASGYCFDHPMLKGYHDALAAWQEAQA